MDLQSCENIYAVGQEHLTTSAAESCFEENGIDWSDDMSTLTLVCVTKTAKIVNS